MSDEARRKELLDHIQAGGGGVDLIRRLYADRPIGELEAAVARVDEARANIKKYGSRLASIWMQDRFTPIK